MGETDRFGGPASWDAECDRRDAAYAALAGEATCLDCGQCVECDIPGHGGVGWCEGIDGFVTGDETVARLGLECFVGA